jgi:hypothetical protein
MAWPEPAWSPTTDVGPPPPPAAAPAEIQAAQARASRMVRDGVLWLCAGLGITVATLLLAPGGFFLICFGPAIRGVSLISRGQKLRARIAAVSPAAAGRPSAPGPR